MSEHYLKTWPEPFAAVKSGRKTCEFRQNDRYFEVGDEIVLDEFDPNTQGHTGDLCRVRVTHIVHGGQFGIPHGYCMMSIERVSK